MKMCMGTLDMFSVFTGPIPPLSPQILKNQCRDQLVFSLISGYSNDQHSLDCRLIHPHSTATLDVSGSVFFKGSNSTEDSGIFWVFH